jgi:hypothetical protein
MNEAPRCPSKDELVTALYGESTPEARQHLDRHLDACVACRDEYASMGALRLALQEWEAPALPSHVRVVYEPPPDEAAAPRAAVVVAGPPRWWASRGVARAALAAAATLVLGLSAGLANLDITVGPQGLSLKTGRGHQEAGAGAAQPGGGAGEVLTSLPEPEAGPDVALAGAPAPGPAEWESALAALERRLRAEMDARVVAAPGPTVALASSRAGDQALLRQVQALIDAAETRQQRNLAQRVTELAREFDVQRKTDLVTIQHGLGQLEGRTQVEAARTRELMNMIVRTSGGAPQR